MRTFPRPLKGPVHCSFGALAARARRRLRVNYNLPTDIKDLRRVSHPPLALIPYAHARSRGNYQSSTGERIAEERAREIEEAKFRDAPSQRDTAKMALESTRHVPLPVIDSPPIVLSARVCVRAVEEGDIGEEGHNS